MNAIRFIAPYKYEGMWVFDDPAVGLVKEPFVGGADTIIDVATAHIPNADRGFVAVFSASYFPDAQITLNWVREDGSGKARVGDPLERQCVRGLARRWIAVRGSSTDRCCSHAQGGA